MGPRALAMGHIETTHGHCPREETGMIIAALVLFLAAASQDVPEILTPTPAPNLSPLGQTATSSAGQVGQKQTREDLAAETGITPMAKIDTRIQNRVQSRIRNRIDRYYDPQANAVSPFEVAGEQLRRGGRRPR